MSEEKRPKYWLHRITGGDNGWLLSYHLLREHGILSTGWSDFSTQEDLASIKSDGIAAIEELMYRCWKWSKEDPLPRNRHCLNRFINKMKPGDVVVVPMWGGTFSICEIADDVIYTNDNLPSSCYSQYNIELFKDGYLYQGNQCIDLGFYRNVRIVEGCLDVPRDSYADYALTSRMKVRQTNVELEDGFESHVLDAIRRWKENCPIEFKKDMSESCLEALQTTINKLFDERQFEELVGRYLKAIGADIVIKPNSCTTPTDAGDADREATFEALKLRISVQIKKHDKDGITDNWGVKQIKAYKDNNPNDEYTTILWLVSNANAFSKEALAEAEGNNRVRLITGDEFARMILEVGLKHFE